MISPKKLLVILFKKLDYGSAIAVRLVKLTGKSPEPIHPKHFLSQRPWYTQYLKQNDVVLDAGCGNGQNVLKAAKFTKRVIGVDMNSDLLAIATSQAKRKKIKNVLFQIANLEQGLNFKDNSFDKIIFLDVLEHLKKRKLIAEEIKRVLKPKGLLFVGVPNKDTSWKKLQRKVGVCYYSDSDHKLEYSEIQIREFLFNHKFEILRFNYGKFDTPLRGLIDIVGSISISSYKKISSWRYKQAKKYPQESSGFEIVAKNLK